MTARTKWKIARIVLTTIYLMGGWLLFTGNLSPNSLSLGFFFSLLVALLTYKLFFHEQEVDKRALLPKVYLLAWYILVLIFKMYIASFELLFSVLRGEINPRVVHFRTHLKSDLARVILASSITLTPGTIAMHLDDDHLIVHWLNAKTRHSKYAGELIKGQFEKLLKRIFI
ncbi:MAG: Na+/H+ antiporter subunit E [bacterium]|nr:Na+/H+ antiporter subunit E [bacterium]